MSDFKDKEYRRQYRRAWHLKNRERQKELMRIYYKNNVDTFAQKKKERYAKKKSEIIEKQREYYNKNKEVYCEARRKRYEKRRTIELEIQKVWRQNNGDRRNHLSALRRAAKIKATPEWLTREQKEQIKLIYSEAKFKTKEDGLLRHVDHVVPLKSKKVCGLHVPWNLQILLAQENMKKSNTIKGETHDQ